MTISEGIESFHQSNGGIYTTEVNHFLRYAIEIRKWSLDEVTDFRGIRTDDIIKSIEYIIPRAYTKKSMARKYFTAISELFLFLINSGVVKNSDFYRKLRDPYYISKSYRGLTNTFVKNNPNLKDSDPNSAFSDDEIDTIIKECDNVFDAHITGYRTIHFSEMATCLCIKLMAFTGAKYSAVYKLPISAYHDGCIEIGSYKIHLPIHLRNQFEIYINIIAALSPEFLFLTRKGTQWHEKSSNSPITHAIQKMHGASTSTMGLTKYGITKLIDVDVSDSVISQITNAKEDVISDCTQTRFRCDKEKYINSRLSKLDLFYRL